MQWHNLLQLVQVPVPLTDHSFNLLDCCQGMQVSAICDDAGVKLHADSGADAVLFEHAGWELVECEVESWAEETCGAAWVAVGLADDSPEEGTDDS